MFGGVSQPREITSNERTLATDMSRFPMRTVTYAVGVSMNRRAGERPWISGLLNNVPHG
jgi:hypothetical protein